MYSSVLLNSLFDSVNSTAIPSYDYKEEDNKYVMQFIAAGYEKSEIKIKLENNYLVIKSNKEQESKLVASTVNYKFRLPYDANLDTIKSNLKNGILTIEVFKKDEKLIDINVD